MGKPSLDTAIPRDRESGRAWAKPTSFHRISLPVTRVHTFLSTAQLITRASHNLLLWLAGSYSILYISLYLNQLLPAAPATRTPSDLQTGTIIEREVLEFDLSIAM